MNSLIIITPIWKDTLNIDELNNIKISLSFNREFQHLFFYGKQLDLSFYKKNFPNSKFHFFEDYQFDTIESYNHLLQSDSFYFTFKSYEYLLILQTDALLVKNIAPLLSLTYDYIGAPWFEGYKVPSFLFQFKYISYFLKKIGFYKFCRVGNGGLSIRKVDIFHNICQRYKPINWLNEDFKFALLIQKKIISAPDFEVAKTIFFEKDSTKLLNLPDVYGYHAIQKYYPKYYCELIISLKYI